MKKLKQIPWISFKKSGQPMIKSNDIESFSKQLTALTTRWSLKKLKKIEKKTNAFFKKFRSISEEFNDIEAIRKQLTLLITR